MSMLMLKVGVAMRVPILCRWLSLQVLRIDHRRWQDNHLIHWVEFARAWPHVAMVCIWLMGTRVKSSNMVLLRSQALIVC